MNIHRSWCTWVKCGAIPGNELDFFKRWRALLDRRHFIRLNDGMSCKCALIFRLCMSVSDDVEASKRCHDWTIR